MSSTHVDCARRLATRADVCALTLARSRFAPADRALIALRVALTEEQLTSGLAR